MIVSPDVEYKELKEHLRYLNEKIIEAFSLFIKLATAIVGGAFFLHWKLAMDDPQRYLLARGLNALLIVVGIAMALIILNNLWAWFGYRRTLSERFPDIPFSYGLRTFLAEALMVILTLTTAIGFTVFNPL